MKLPVAMGLFALLLGGCGKIGSAEVEDAWIRLPAVQGHPGAAYFHLRAGKDAEVLLAVSTPAAIRSELHESMKMDGGMMTMAPLKQIAVRAGHSLTFAPGGKHVMLFDVSPSLKAGTTATLVLKFADGETLETKAKVVGAGDRAPPAEGRS